MKHGALMHEAEDDVAVVIVDTAAGTDVQAVTLAGKEIAVIKAIQDIPLGHKIAVREVAEGSDVIKYGRPIGRATVAIRAGSHVHTHNIRSKRWA